RTNPKKSSLPPPCRQGEKQPGGGAAGDDQQHVDLQKGGGKKGGAGYKKGKPVPRTLPVHGRQRPADQSQDTGANSGKGVLHDAVALKSLQHIGDSCNDEKRGEHHPQGAAQSAPKAADPVAHKGGGVDGNG